MPSAAVDSSFFSSSCHPLSAPVEDASYAAFIPRVHTYSASGTATTGTARPATTSTATATGGLATAVALTMLTIGTLSLLASSLGLAGKLDGDLTLKDLLAGELSDGTLSLSGGGQVDKGIADRAVGTRVLGNGDRLAVDARLLISGLPTKPPT